MQETAGNIIAMASKNRFSPIPHPPTRPLVGNLLSLDSIAPMQDLARLAKELGPIFWLDMMGAPLVVVSGHGLVDELSDEKRFDKAVRGSLRRVRAVAGDGLFTADTNEPNWSKAHSILMQAFGNRAMQSYHPSMVDVAEQLAKKWERLSADDEIDVVHDMTALTLDTIGLCGFDYRFNSFYRLDYHPFVESLVRSLETIMMTRGLPLENLWMQKRRRDLAADVAFMNKMVDEIIAERRKNAEAAEGKKDMLGAMMTGVDRATGEQLDDVNIRYQINTFLIAGYETSSALLSCTLYALLKNPDVLKKAYEEVDRVLGPDIEAKPTYQQVTQLNYITQILKEALRLWPPTPAYGIAPLNDETIGGKYKLKKNAFITVLVLALHRDASVWGPNPDAFDPENFSREAEAKRPINAWKPFGNGQRACIGRGFAMHAAALAIGMILQRFKLIDHQRYQMHLKETLAIKPDGFKIKVQRRAEKERISRDDKQLEDNLSAGPGGSVVPVNRSDEDQADLNVFGVPDAELVDFVYDGLMAHFEIVRSRARLSADTQVPSRARAEAILMPRILEVVASQANRMRLGTRASSFLAKDGRFDYEFVSEVSENLPFRIDDATSFFERLKRVFITHLERGETLHGTWGRLVLKGDDTIEFELAPKEAQLVSDFEKISQFELD
jgi:cytochrome P450/NADPH-cytochrome P450 reductase